jgi:phage tail protein X
MKLIHVTFILLVVVNANYAIAQITPTLGSETPRVCPDQSPQPEWVDRIPLREAKTKC